MKLSVVICTHCPHPARLRRTLAALRAQTLPATEWECILVDNASTPPLRPADWTEAGPAGLRFAFEPALGLSHARRRGLREAVGEFVVMVDDDNELAVDYLAGALRRFADHPRVGLLGGRSIPEFEQTPPSWVRDFDDLLACRDLGGQARVSAGLRDAATGRRHYPVFAPIGAGMALRREAACAWLEAGDVDALPDRQGSALSSGGDNDIVLTAMRTGWEVGYFPELQLTHLIPAGRTTADYLARLNRDIARSWIQVLHKHDASPWTPIAAWTVPLRCAKAWFAYRAWSGPAAHVRWRGACGHFEGRAALATRAG